MLLFFSAASSNLEFSLYTDTPLQVCKLDFGFFIDLFKAVDLHGLLLWLSGGSKDFSEKKKKILPNFIWFFYYLGMSKF